MNQFVLAGIAAVVVAGGAFTAGWRVNDWRHDAQDLRDAKLTEKIAAAATDAAVAAIKGNRPIYTTINRALEKEFRSEVRFTSPDCSHTPESWGLLDRAYQAAGGEPFSSGASVPVAPAPAGPDARRDN